MKKFYSTLLFTLLFSLGAFAQGAAEGLLYSTNHYEGTARTMALGNAFTALGGDIGAITINPASSGVFRYSQLTVSPSFISSRGVTDYLGVNSKEAATRLALSNLGYVGSFDTGNYRGLLNYNIGVTLNRTNSFNTIMRANGTTSASSKLGNIASGLKGINSADLESSSGYDPYENNDLYWGEILAWNTYLIANVPGTKDQYLGSTENIYGNDIEVGGPLNQDYYKKTTGGVQEFTFNFGGNISDVVYFGVNLNIASLYYESEEYYSETAERTSDFQDGFVHFRSPYWQTSTGTGFSMKFGVIANPVAGLRIGATFTTPTWYEMSDNWQLGMESSFSNNNSYTKYSPTGVYDYRITTPMRWSVGAAYTIGKVALISADYENVDYSTIKMADANGNKVPFSDVNDQIRRNFISSDIFRLGAEINILHSLSIRGGYNHYGTPGDNYPAIRYVTGGLGFKLGYRGKTNLDIAYQRMLNNSESFSLYGDYDGIAAPTGDYTYRNNKFVITLGIKF
ncbi:MAG: hypothetical protein PHD11_05895 [Bacteroidales bacterium]|nr:hypothetical protein [Bacteroidales bacterium]MDD4670494.1 hypothetical protein [Bacteroidales bacterium]